MSDSPVNAGLGTAPTSESRAATYATARWTLEGRGSLLATANPTKAGRTSVSLTHQRLEGAQAVGPAKEAMREWLAAVSSGAPSGLG
jgi:hypothetical protein